MAATPNVFHQNASQHAENEPFAFTQAEVERIRAAVKEEEFVRLLADYARELADPESRRRYEADIAALERERGYQVTFLKPRPGYVIRTVALSGAGAKAPGRGGSSSSKIFVNVCSDENVSRPTSQAVAAAGTAAGGLQWSLPYSLAQPRRDCDKSGEACMVYDVIFHPDTLYLAAKDTRMKDLVNATALDALESSFNVKADRAQVRLPKMAFKGVFRPTVIRRPMAAESSAMAVEREMTEKNEVPTAPARSVAAPPTGETIVPSYDIRYRSHVDLQDFVIKANTADCPDTTGRPKELLLDIHLPLLDSAAGVELDVQERWLVLERSEAPRYQLRLALPYPVNEADGSAKFDKATRRLTVTLPIKAVTTLPAAAAAPLPKTERLSSNDSGIDLSDDGYRTAAAISDGAAPSDCDNMESARPAVTMQGGNGLDHRTTGDCDEKFATEVNEDDFLEPGLSYSLPTFTAAVQPPVISFTLEVKNVDPATIVKRVWPGERRGGGGVAVRFASLGTGLYPLHHAFAVQFLDLPESCSLDEHDLEIECWDNNVVVQLSEGTSCGHHHLRTYRVGTSLATLRDRLYTLDRTSLALKDHEAEGKKSSGKRKPKYNQEKHPKIMAAVKLADHDETMEEKARHSSGDERGRHSSGDERGRHSSGDERGRHSSSEERDRHSSGESLDSMMSVSPYERIQLLREEGQGGCKAEGEEEDVEEEEEEESEGEEGEEGRGQPPRYMRATSCEEGLETRRLKVKGILKKRKNQEEAYRLRCYSESNVDEYGWNSVGSSGLSQTRIMEEEEEGQSFKKSVRFSEKVHQQVFRTNSTILAKTAKNKRKAEKKRKAIERRVSEGDAQAVAVAAARTHLVRTTSLEAKNADDESHDDSGLASSFEEAIVLGGGDGRRVQEEKGGAGSGGDGGSSSKAKLKKKTKKKTKQFEMSSDLIFDLDI